MPAAENILEVQDLNVWFPGEPPFEAVRQVSFHIAAGKTLALVGQSGSGKSVTSLAIMGLLPPSARIEGNICLAGAGDINKWSQAAYSTIRGKTAGMIFQEPMSALNPVKKCGHQLMESILAHQDLPKREARLLAIQWMEQVKLPDCPHLFHRYPHQLSGGQKQRIMIAMAMCNHPKLLIADEPTTALDVTVQQDIIRLMRQLQDAYGVALLFITHDLALAGHIADDFLMMENGRITHRTTDFQLPRLRTEPPVSLPESKPLLQVCDVDVVYPVKKSMLGKEHFFKAVDKVRFHIDEGETLGLVGESGCGKSTLSKAILGLQPVTAGQIVFEEKEISRCSASEWRKLRRDIQVVFQDPYASLNPRIKVGDAIKEPLLIHRIAAGRQQLERSMEHLLELVGLPRSAGEKYPHEFSGGQRQRICIARALAVNPRLVICDESVSALDIKIQSQILKLLKDLQQEKKLTYLFITHDLSVVQAISDRIMVMEKGSIVEQGATENIMLHPKHPYTQRLLAAAL